MLYSISPEAKLIINSQSIDADPSTMYRVEVEAIGYEGAKHCAYMIFIALNQQGQEIRRRVRWFDQFHGLPVCFNITAKPHFGAVKVLLGYRINTELPPQYSNPSNVKIELPPVETLKLIPTQETDESYDMDWFDYEREWKIVNLETDYYTIVGPSSAKEYIEAGRWHFACLELSGMKPDSSILDVGCGTGSLTVSLIDYLDENGVYVGTDIAEEAILYCRHKFPARFKFLKNESTRIPIEGEEFDFIAFFSVFTHTYANETLELLKEAKRLVKETGSVIADIFICPTTTSITGTRDRIEMNEDYFQGLVNKAGFCRADRFGGGPGIQSIFIIRP